MASESTYESIDRPYGAFLEREPTDVISVGDGAQPGDVAQSEDGASGAGSVSPGGGGTPTETTIKGTQSFSDVWIDKEIRSRSWKPKKVGFMMNGETGYAEFSNVFVAGAITAGNLHVPDQVTTESFHVDNLGNVWWGANVADWNSNHDNAEAYVLNTGVAKFQNITITGGSVATSTLSGTIAQANLNVADRGWSQTCAFSVSDADTVAWGAGSLTSADGTVYSIGANNTGNMAAKTYIYLDIAASTTAYQVTTTPATAVGVGKILVATAQNGSAEAVFSVLSGQGGQNIDGANIVAATITSNEIAANTIIGNNIAAGTITSGKLSVSQLSAITADLGSITAGTVTGATIQTSSSGFRMKMNGATQSYEFLFNSLLLAELVSTTIPDTDSGGAALKTAGGVTMLAASYQADTSESVLLQNDDSSIYFGILHEAFGTEYLINNAQIAGHWTPQSSGSYNLGTSSRRWNDIYGSGTSFFSGKLKIPVGTNLY